MQSDRLAVVVVNFDSSALLESNLTAVHRAIPAVVIVVVDNYSSDVERARVRAMSASHGWQLVETKANHGFGGGANRGVAAALKRGVSDVLLLNPDARIDRSSVEQLEGAVRDSRLTLASPVVMDPSGRIWFSGLDLDLMDGSIRAPRRRPDHPGVPYIEWLSGACLLITRELWELVGGFDEEYFLYWEDVDFSRRVTESGGHLKVVSEAVAIHDEGGTQRSRAQRAEAKSDIYYYFNIRNRMLYAAKYLDAEGVLLWRRTAVRNAYAILLRGGKRQFLRPSRPVRAALRGLRDGRRIAREYGTARR